MNFDDRELNKQKKKKTEKKKITSSNSFLAFLRSHHTVYRNFFYNIPVYSFVSMTMALSVYILPGQSHLTLPIKLFPFPI